MLKVTALVAHVVAFGRADPNDAWAKGQTSDKEQAWNRRRDGTWNCAIGQMTTMQRHGHRGPSRRRRAHDSDGDVAFGGRRSVRLANPKIPLLAKSGRPSGAKRRRDCVISPSSGGSSVADWRSVAQTEPKLISESAQKFHTRVGADLCMLGHGHMHRGLHLVNHFTKMSRILAPSSRSLRPVSDSSLFAPFTNL